MMDGETSLVSHCNDDAARDRDEFESIYELSNEGNQAASAVSLDLILSDDLLGRILACLPAASVLRVGSVCKRWHELLSSRRLTLSQELLQKMENLQKENAYLREQNALLRKADQLRSSGIRRFMDEFYAATASEDEEFEERSY